MQMAIRLIVVSILFSITAGFIGSEATSSSAPTPAVQNQASAADGQALIGEACIQCHSLDPIFSQRKSAEEWAETVNLMNWRGAQLFPGEAEAIAEYLAANFGLDSSLAPSHGASQSSETPVGDAAGEALVSERCVMCHSLDIVTIQEKTGGEWEQTIEKMVGYGLTLTDDEAKLIVAHLEKAYGLD